MIPNNPTGSRRFYYECFLLLLTPVFCAQGATIRLPTGELVVVPKYATETSARICALTGGMGAVGLRVTFYPWQAALNGILLK